MAINYTTNVNYYLNIINMYNMIIILFILVEFALFTDINAFVFNENIKLNYINVNHFFFYYNVYFTKTF